MVKPHWSIWWLVILRRLLVMGRIVVDCEGTKVRKSFSHLRAGGVEMITTTSYVATVACFSVEITVNSLPLFKGE
ncbi:hypothetical protein D5086_027024 [Populus alba]|uniref:Uncharacterized protein n=1 Tax=Populus alba TaxID=43335 RepID=A0ACC4B3S5_POPAL